MIRNAFTTFQSNTPQVFVDVDRDKAQMLRVPLNAIFEALRIYMGSAYVNDFNMFGRTYRVTAQADGDFRTNPDNVASIRVRSTDGAMVPLGSLVSFRSQMGPERLPRYNLFPTVEISGQGAPGVSSGQALEIMHELAGRVLPRGRDLRVDRPVVSGAQRGDARATGCSCCRSCSCSWRWPPSTRAGRCRSRSS